MTDSVIQSLFAQALSLIGQGLIHLAYNCFPENAVERLYILCGGIALKAV